MGDDARRFVVIGGGLAGLASAVWLAEAGCTVTLLERRGSLGGRAHAMRAETGSNGPGDVPDNGQHIIASGYQHLYRYLTSVGTRQHIAFPKSSTLRWPDGRKVTMQTTGVGAIRTLFGVHPDASWADRLRAARATVLLGWQALRQPADLADISTEQWFDRVGMPAPAREALWDWLALGIAAEPVAQESAKVFANVLGTGIRLGIKHRTPVTIGYPTVDLDTLYIEGALKVFEERGVDVRYRAVARRIVIGDGIGGRKVTGVLLADGTEIPADAVVCAVPNSNIAGLLDDLPEHPEIYAAADKLGYTPIVSTNLYLDRPLGTESAFEGLIGGTGVIDEVFDRQIMHGRSTERSWLYCLTTSGAYEQIHKSNEEIVAEQLALLRRYYPAATEAKVLEAQVVKMPRATFSQVVGTDSLRPPQRTSVPSLVLAGDWTATDWSATMESAVQSAAKAVDLLLA